MDSDFENLVKNRSLSTSFRGYDRDETDHFLSALQASLRTLLAERSAAQVRLADLEAQLAEARLRESEVTEALVVAANVRAESERAVQELKVRSEHQAEAIEQEAQRRAEKVVADARATADAIVAETREKERQLEVATRLADEARDRVASFLETLLAEVRRPRDGLSSTDDALAILSGVVVQDGIRNARMVDRTGPSPTSR